MSKGNVLLMKDEEIIFQQHGNINGKEGEVVLTNQRLFLNADSALKAGLTFGLIGAAVHASKKTVSIDLKDIRAIGPMNKSGFEILLSNNTKIKGAFSKGVGLMTVNGQVASKVDIEMRDSLLEYISKHI